MKTHSLIFLLLLTLTTTLAQKSSSGKEVHQLVALLKEKHYSPKAMDDQFSEKLFFKFIQSLDKKHLLFLKPEITEFSKSKLQLDDQLNQQQLSFITQVAPVYRSSLERSRKILETLKTRGFKTNKDEKYVPFYKDSMDYAANEAALAVRWDQYIRLEVFIKDFQNSADSLSAKPSFEQLYLKAIGKHIQKLDASINENKNSLKYFYYRYAKCIPELFDAHSNYMSYNDFQNFEAMLSTENYKFGITVDKNKLGAIEIVRLTPGSPAWRSGKINIGDVITHLQWQNSAKIDLSELEVQEVIELLDLSNTLMLEFTLKSATGEIQRVSLKKEKTESSENNVKGYVLTGKDNRKIGYICLPSFYTLFESENMLGCANDVAKELVKLQQEKIEGLLFDLRNNGGGSLKEGLELCGIFINEGTLAMQKTKGASPVLLKDWNRGVAYQGPMVVMVNGHSASASELMASTLQDFNRAVVVGTPTYGKATGQEMFMLNPGETGVADSLRSGFASITVLKLYRVTGKSNQLIGLQPDIVLPDPFENLYENESKEAEALPRDTVSRKTYYQALPLLPLEKLRMGSTARISESNDFQQVKALAVKYRDAFDTDDVPVTLNAEGIRKKYGEYMQWMRDIKKYYYSETDLFKVSGTTEDETLYKLSEEDRVLSEHAIERIKTDLTIEESYLILNDLLNLK